ncbi:CRTAC1 family protein [Sedimentisphaera salicampi]|uniref:FG-GAP repeat containing protein n=1 Tax=Sedimentisphaera salicampi TaxID=1941349 RepID=A0A1W6LKN6_9BACT|nr:CRTAC1 family protein [Sedimentisphaera salicampi]ARN56337.1 FG-GAP repeat containing protein [Sedimentisphaera salicampi]
MKRNAAVIILAVSAVFAESRFADKTSQLGLKLSKGSVSCVDYNRDGWADLYCNGTLWKNNQGKGFEKVFQSRGRAVFSDFNNDGFPDMFVYNKQRLLINQGGQAFKETEFPDLPIGSSLSACCADFNSDGFTDIYIAGYENRKKGLTYPDALILNRKDKGWEKVWQVKKYRARGAAACDFDRDSDADVYVSNYRLQPNLLWVNNGSGEFENKAELYNAQAGSGEFNGGHSIGAVWADFDNDGFFDIFAGNFAHKDSRGTQPESVFLRNKGSHADYIFEDMGQCGLHYQESYASPAAGDYDNDGDVDLFFTTVYKTASFGKKNHPVLYRNEGSWQFTNVTQQAGLSGLSPTYQAAWADFNNDGFIDLVTDRKVFINQGNGNSWLKVQLVGDGERIDKDAAGSQVFIQNGQSLLVRQVEIGTGQGNQNQKTLHFGLGKRQKDVVLKVRWLNGAEQEVSQVSVNSSVKVTFNPTSEKSITDVNSAYRVPADSSLVGK